MKESEVDEYVEELSTIAMVAMNGIVSNVNAVEITTLRSRVIANASFKIARAMLVEKEEEIERLKLLAENNE